MFVRNSDTGPGHFFADELPQHVAMWMKKTLLPLDMLFVDQAGCVAKTVRDARPGSLDTISADGQIALVVELKGGTTKALGIEAGDRVSQRPDANWPDRGLPCTRQR